MRACDQDGPKPGLACADALRLPPREFEHLHGDQPVMHHDVRLVETVAGLEREQLRVARPGAYEGNKAGRVGCRSGLVE